jgi:Glutaredoxin-like domain (DUF836)
VHAVTSTGAPRVLLVGRAGCHLCDDARAVVSRVAAELGEAWREVSVDDDAALRNLYAELIPVVMVDGVQVDFWRVDESRLRSALTRERGARPA